MTDNDFRQWPTAESRGIDAGYEKERPKALAELDAQMAGPKHLGVAVDGEKNPGGEFENPAPFTGPPQVRTDGPNGVGNSSGNGDIDPQGQQGGTGGGQPAKPSLPNELHPVADEAERDSQDRTRA